MYEYSLCTYIDILGFKKLIETQPPENIKNILIRLSQESHRDQETTKEWAEDFNCSFSSYEFSDLIVRLYKFKEKPNQINKIIMLSNEIENLAKIQRETPTYGFTIRGAISFDKIYSDNKIIFGPALVQSYQLESSIANYPRIIIDKELGDEIFERIQEITELEEDQRGIEEMTFINLKKILKKDGDYFYIDYFNYTPEDFDYLLATEDEFFLSHYELIKNCLKSETNSKVLEKYEWLRKKHNIAFKQAKLKNPDLGEYSF